MELIVTEAGRDKRSTFSSPDRDLLTDVKVNSPDRDDLTGVKVNVVDLRDEDRRHRFVERRAVHVDGGADRKYEATDATINAGVLLQTAHRDRKRR